MNKPPTQIIRPVGIPSGEKGGTPGLKVAHSFSIQILQSADLFTELSSEIEEDFSGTASRDEKVKHRALVTAAIMLAWSFIEASINELYWAAKHNKVSLEGLSAETREAIATISEETKTLDRYQIALALAKKELYKNDAFPYQDVNLLRLLRNKLIHYEPEWISGEPQKIEKQLTGKFGLNPFVEKVKGSPFFPFGCLSGGCAKWALKSALQFVDDFHSRLAIKPKYESVRSGLIITQSKRRA